MRFGNQEISISIFIIGSAPMLLMILYHNDILVRIFSFFSLFFMFMGIGWINYIISRNRLSPLINRASPDETVWLRFTKDRIFIPQFVRKGPYGQTKGVVFREKADVLDDGDFPVKTLNGNPGIIVYDMMNTSVDLKKSVVRKQMSDIFNIRSGREGYKLAKEKKMVIK